MFQFLTPSFTHDKGTYIQTKIYGSKLKTYLLYLNYCIMVLADYFKLWRLESCSYSFYLRSVGTIHSSVKWLNPFFLRSQRCVANPLARFVSEGRLTWVESFDGIVMSQQQRPNRNITIPSKLSTHVKRPLDTNLARRYKWKDRHRWSKK